MGLFDQILAHHKAKRPRFLGKACNAGLAFGEKLHQTRPRLLAEEIRGQCGFFSLGTHAFEFAHELIEHITRIADGAIRIQGRDLQAFKRARRCPRAIGGHITKALVEFADAIIQQFCRSAALFSGVA